MKTAKILRTARGTSPSHCALRYVELEELIGEFGRRTRLGKLAAALRTRLEEEDWDSSDLSVARAEYEKQLDGPDSEFMAELARKATSARSHPRGNMRAGAARHRTMTSES
jgi:hypothetical protein